MTKLTDRELKDLEDSIYDCIDGLQYELFYLETVKGKDVDIRRVHVGILESVRELNPPLDILVKRM